MDPCTWHQCIDPPVPEGQNLKHLWDGVPKEFGENVRYECKTAQLFFEHDRELQGFELDCLEDGSFDEPDAWFKCVSSKLFFYIFNLLTGSNN